jgi:hypothetical protein
MPKNFKKKDRNPNDPDIPIQNPTHRHNRIFMHTISRKYPTKYLNILKAQKLKRITEDTMKIMG